MAGGRWAQKVQLGRETTAGTAVAATAIWRGIGGMLRDDRKVTIVEELIGVALPTDRSYIAELGAILEMAPTPATFEQIPHLFEAGIKAVGTGATDGSGSNRVYSYPVGKTSLNTIKTYTIESGDNQQGEEAEYCFVSELTITAEPKKAVMMSANWMGRQVTNASFTGALSAPTVEEILPKGAFYLDAVSGTYGGTQKTQTLLQFSLKLTTGWRPKWSIDNGQIYFDFVYFDRDSYKVEVEATYEHNSDAVTEKTAWRNETPRLMRVQFPGSTLTTAGSTFSTKLLRLDLPIKYTEVEALDAADGNSIIKMKAMSGYNESAAEALTCTVVNELTSVP
jgi:hypothetical protein